MTVLKIFAVVVVLAAAVLIAGRQFRTGKRDKSSGKNSGGAVSGSEDPGREIRERERLQR